MTSPRPTTRRQLLAGAAGLAGLAFTSTIRRAVADSEPANRDPVPVPGGGSGSVPGRHVYINGTDPATGQPYEPSTIYDFRGVSGVSNVLSSGIGTGPGGEPVRLYTNSDMRFMAGDYVGVDGRRRTGAFGFV
jgi:hypothetical protein